MSSRTILVLAFLLVGAVGAMAQEAAPDSAVAHLLARYLRPSIGFGFRYLPGQALLSATR